MRLIGPLDAKPFYGLAVAAVLGLMVGGALRPSDEVLDRLETSQMLPSTNPARVYATSSSASSYDNYRWGIPDYVVGTDWLQPAMTSEPEPQAEPEPEAYVAPVREPVRYVVARYDPPEETVIYPSMGGGVVTDDPTAPEADQPVPAPEGPEPG